MAIERRKVTYFLTFACRPETEQDISNDRVYQQREMAIELNKHLSHISMDKLGEIEYEADEDIDPANLEEIVLTLPEIKSMEDYKFAEKLIALNRFLERDGDPFLERVTIIHCKELGNA